ncbi:MAG: hypothetical protein WDO69_05245 [Pseudomonadota bacterium]
MPQHQDAGHVAESEPLAGDGGANPSVTDPNPFRVTLGGLAGESALRGAMQAAMAIGDWATVKDLAEALQRHSWRTARKLSIGHRWTNERRSQDTARSHRYGEQGGKLT